MSSHNPAKQPRCLVSLALHGHAALPARAGGGSYWGAWVGSDLTIVSRNDRSTMRTIVETTIVRNGSRSHICRRFPARLSFAPLRFTAVASVIEKRCGGQTRHGETAEVGWHQMTCLLFPQLQQNSHPATVCRLQPLAYHKRDRSLATRVRMIRASLRWAVDNASIVAKASRHKHKPKVRRTWCSWPTLSPDGRTVQYSPHGVIGETF